MSKCSCCGLDWQFEFLSTIKLANNPMAGLHNTSENFWVGKVCLACAYNVHTSIGETCQYGRDRHNVLHRVLHGVMYLVSIWKMLVSRPPCDFPDISMRYLTCLLCLSCSLSHSPAPSRPLAEQGPPAFPLHSPP